MILRLLLRSLPGKVGVGMSLMATLAIVAMPHMGALLAIMVLALPSLVMVVRATPYEASLPIPARHIFLTRLLFTLGLTCAPVVVWIILTSGAAHSSTAARGLFEVSLTAKVTLLALATLTSILPNVVRPGDLDVSKRYDVYTPFLIFALATLLPFGGFDPGIEVAIAAAAIAAGTVVVTWRAFPKSFHIVRAAAVRSVVANASTAAANSNTRDAWPWRTVFRSVVSPLTIVSALGILGMAVGSMWVVMLALTMSGEVVRFRHQTRWMFGLPISHRHFMLINLLISVAPLLAGLAIGQAAFSVILRGADSLNYQAPHATSSSPFTYDSTVPLEYWEVKPDGQPQVIRADWREVSATDTLAVLGTTYFNPYSAERTTSERFRNWQFERATNAIYGSAVALPAYQAGTVRLPRRLKATTEMLILNVGVVASLALFLVFLCEFPRWHLLGRRPWMRIVAMVLGVGAVVALSVIEFYYLIRHQTPIAWPLLQRALFQLTDALPRGPVPALAAAALPVVATFLLLQWQFSKSEFPDRVARRAA